MVYEQQSGQLQRENSEIFLGKENRKVAQEEEKRRSSDYNAEIYADHSQVFNIIQKVDQEEEKRRYSYYNAEIYADHSQVFNIIKKVDQEEEKGISGDSQNVGLFYPH